MSDSFEEGPFHAATRREAMNKRSGGEHQVAKSKGSGLRVGFYVLKL